MERKIQNTKYLTGQAMITAVIFFMFVSLTILLGLAGPILRQTRIVSDLIRSRDSFFLAEAGMEDTLYRLRNGLPTTSGQTVGLGGFTASTDITDIVGGKIVVTEASWNGHVRKVETRLTTGVGAAFNYAVQTGAGGFVFGNNAGISGNVYSNGNIIGGPNSFITGSAYAANSIPLSADQSNLTPPTPTNWITFRNTSATQDVAQKFQISTTSIANKVQFMIRKNGSPSNATVRVVTDNAGNPSTSVLTTGTLSAALVTTRFSIVDVVFSSNPQLSAGTQYWVVIDNSSNSTSNYYVIAANVNYASGQAKIGQQGGTWNNTTPSGLDAYFAFYLGGLVATISGTEIGTGSTGDAWAHTINNVTVANGLFCQTGSGNNKPCDTSRPDPSPRGFPISEGNIAQWKSEAEAGGIINGNVTIYDDSATLGPVKIIGNLTIENNSEVIVGGTVWVTGNITVVNNVQVRLTAGFGTDDGVIVTDGLILISNNAEFFGSGTTGSYIMLLTTSDCPISPSCGGADAIDIKNNAGTVILNAQKGTIHFSNNAGAKLATAYKISLDNNVVIEYESGLADSNFSSGPSGGWNILSWKEVE